MSFWGSKGKKDPYRAEQEAADEIGGQRSIASGAIFGDYDANSEEWRVDQKVTTAKSFAVRYDTLPKIRDSGGGVKPLLRVEFSEYNQIVYVVDHKDFVRLMEISRGEG